MKRILGVVSVLALLLTTCLLSGALVFAEEKETETETARLYKVVVDKAYKAEERVTVLKESECLVGAAQGVLIDPWGRSEEEWQDHRRLVKGEYNTFKFAVDPTATKLLINDAYFSNSNWNYFGVQMSSDGTKWYSIGDYASNEVALPSGWKWSSMDESWGRDNNNKTIMERCALDPVTGLKIVYVRLVASWNNAEADGSAEHPYAPQDGSMIWYNNFYVDVERPKAAVESISVKTAPKTEYDYNTELDIGGGTIEVVWDSGWKQVIPMTAEMISGFDSSASGAQSVTVTYGGKTTTYAVNIGDRAISGIELTAEPTKKSYKIGESLDVTGGKLTLSYEDGGATSEIDVTADMVTGFNSSAIAAAQTLTVTYAGFTDTYEVSIKEANKTGATGEFSIDSSGAFGLEVFEKAEREAREAEFAAGFHWDQYIKTRPNAHDHLLMMKDQMLAYSFFPFGVDEKTVNTYVNIEPEGYITYELDLPDRVTGFTISGWGGFKRCQILASKDDGKTWYVISAVGKTDTGMSGWKLPDSGVDNDLVTQDMVTQYKKNIQKVLTGNPEKKFLLKIANSEYGSIMYANVIINYTYNTGEDTVGDDLPLTDETLEQEKAEGAAVDALIDKIGVVAYTDASKALIDAARAAYDGLSEWAKVHVTGLSTLTDAEEQYDTLKQAAEEENNGSGTIDPEPTVPTTPDLTDPTDPEEDDPSVKTGVGTASLALLVCASASAAVLVRTRKRK